MTVMQASGLTVVGLLVGGFAGWQIAELNAAKAAPPPGAAGGRVAEVNKQDLNDSPVRVVGGSITARAQMGWVVDASGKCAAKQPCCYMRPCNSGDTPNLAILALIGTENLIQNQPAPIWSPIAQNWTVEIFDRNPTDPMTNGIVLCSKQNCTTDTALASPGPVYLQPEAANSRFYPVPAPQDDATADAGWRFNDTDSSGCAAKTVVIYGVGKNPTPDQDWCEHIGSIRVTIGANPYTYICPDGACKVKIGQ